MASIVIPGQAGSAISGFNNSLLQALALRRQFDRDAQLARLEELRLQQGQMALDEQRRGAEQAQLVRSVVPQVMGMQPTSVPVGPGTPDRLMAPTQGIPGENAAEAVAPGMGTVVPGTVPPTVQQLTMGDVTRQVGPEAAAAMLTNPQGQAVLAAKGVISEEEAKRRRDRATAIERFKKSQADSLSLYKEGKGEEGLLAERSAYQAMAEVADDPTRVMQQARDLTTAYLALREKKEQIPLLNEDMQRLSVALAKFKERPDFDTHAALMQAATSMQSDFGKKKGIELLQQIAQGKLDEIKFLPFRQAERRTAEIMDQADKTGQPMARSKALQQTFREQPQLRAEIIGAMAASNKLPSDYSEALFGGDVPKSDREEVDQALTTRGFVRGTKEYSDQFEQRLTNLQRDRARQSSHDQGLDRLVTLRGQAVQEINNLQRALQQAISPEEQADIKAQMDFIQKQRIPSLDAAIEGRPAVARPTSPAGAPPLPMPMPTGGPPARAIEPPTRVGGKPITQEELTQRAVAEFKRLISRGHTRETAVAEMQRRGWDVKWGKQ